MPPSTLTASAQGASSLVLLQLFSRALTFLVNQILLRYLSPSILGAATQFEVLSTSSLYLFRESTRVALQRQQPTPSPSLSTKQNGDPAQQDAKEKVVEEREKEVRDGGTSLQQSINATYIPIGVGIPLTLLFTRLYLRSADPAVLAIPFARKSLNIYALATILELLHEPFFATASHQLSYAVRTGSEMQATFLRCIATCLVAVYAHYQGREVGVLPFAIGQFIYAGVLLVGYAGRLYVVFVRTRTSALFRRPSGGEEYVEGAMVKLAGVMYAQSLFKQLLTNGDAYLVAALTTLEAQGAYALAGNYGGLMARVLFQPVEEASRTFFAREVPKGGSSGTDGKGEGVKHVERYLRTLLRFYGLLALGLVFVAPPLTGPALRLVAGKRWAETDAPSVLSAYCYYIPFLAFNGLLEAYVSAVASPSDLRRQSYFMVGFSCLFALLGVVILGKYEAGALGLVLANTLVMLGRIAYSWKFIGEHLKERQGNLKFVQCLPEAGSFAMAIAMRGVLEKIVPARSMAFVDVLAIGALIGVGGAGILIFERTYLQESWSMLRSGPVTKIEGTRTKKES